MRSPDDGAVLAKRLRAAAEQWPDKVAFQDGHVKATYRELFYHADLYASALGHGSRALEGTRVAVVARDGVEAYAALLACLLHQAVFIPVNPEFALERNHDVLSRSDPHFVVTCEEHLVTALAITGSRPLLNLSTRTWVSRSEQVEVSDPTDAAYLLFTSGSTGGPKGVPIRPGNVLSMIDGMQSLYPLLSHDRVAQTFELTFDLSMYSTIGAWLSGASVVVAGDLDRLDPCAFVDANQITVWFSVPSVAVNAQNLGALGIGVLESLRLSLFCGEALPYDIAQLWARAAPNSVCINLYGPTEATIACSHHPVDRSSASHGLVPIGVPLPGVKFAVLGITGDVVPNGDGSPGELLVGGQQVFEGYWRDQWASERAFHQVDDHGITTQWYRTGDRVKQMTDGSWLYIGRLDDQVQVMGHRVEVREVERATADCFGLKASDVVVVPRANDHGTVDTLVAWLVTDQPPQNAAQRLTTMLPTYMIPSDFRAVPRFPLNSNGKIDRKILTTMAKRNDTVSQALTAEVPK